VSRRIAFRGSVSSSKLKDHPEELFNGTILVDNLEVRILRYVLSLQWNHFLRREPEEGMGYLLLGIGIMSHKTSGTILIEYSGDIYVADANQVPSEDKFIVTVGGGYIFNFDKSSGLDIGFSLDFLTSQGEVGLVSGFNLAWIGLL